MFTKLVTNVCDEETNDLLISVLFGLGNQYAYHLFLSDVIFVWLCQSRSQTLNKIPFNHLPNKYSKYGIRFVKQFEEEKSKGNNAKQPP
jgi:hypothetical protein